MTHLGSGDIDIDVRGGSFETRGIYSYGIYGFLLKADHGGGISIETGGGNTVTTRVASKPAAETAIEQIERGLIGAPDLDVRPSLYRSWSL